ncbi:MAG TPA: HNH endonuclease signature motif containing protein, partial [Ornithinimicrobium sp.]|nr:HNH endonuclease signature motif containing protein [Ornithinimicrobium sp.]
EGALDVPAADLDAVAGGGSLALVRCRMEAVQLVAVADLALRTGRRLLEEKGVADPEGLSATAWARWRARMKSLVAAELEVTLGVGRGEARDMVAVACAPEGIGAPVLEALGRGEVPWHLVRRFWTKAGSLPVEDVVTIARVLFGTVVEEAARERLDPDGELHGRPWAVKEFHAALDREVVRARGKDERSARKARDEAVASRDAWLRVHDDGTATLGVRTPLISGVGVFARVDRMARVLRGGGEGRSLAQLRSDLCATLLLHGTVAVPEVVDDLVTPEDVQMLAAVTTASPPVSLQVVVPWDALAGGVVCPRCTHAVPSRNGDGDGSSAVTCLTLTKERCAWPPVPDWLARRCGHEAGAAGTERGLDGPPSRPAAQPPPFRSPVVGQPPLPGVAWSGTVAELLGLHPAFLTPGHARELALAPGTTMHRILTDPADGRCIERTITAYRPDAEMRRQVAAADVYGRGPGERTPPERWQIDHEHEHQDGGPTAETNLNGKGVFFHAVKTARLWSSVMNERRDVTWTTLLRQVVTTRGHDYRQYLSRVDALAPEPGGHGPERSEPAGDEGDDSAPTGDAVDRPTMADRADLANRLLYAAIVHRHAGAPARASDDIVDAEAYDLRLAGWASIDPRLALSREGRHADLRGPTPEQLLGLVAPARDSRTQGPSQGWATRPGPHDPPPF